MSDQTKTIDLEATYDRVNDLNGGKGLRLTIDGVEGFVKVYRSEWHQEIVHEATAKGRRSAKYRETRARLGDDYTTTLETGEEFFAAVEKQP